MTASRIFRSKWMLLFFVTSCVVYYFFLSSLWCTDLSSSSASSSPSDSDSSSSSFVNRGILLGLVDELPSPFNIEHELAVREDDGRWKQSLDNNDNDAKDPTTRTKWKSLPDRDPRDVLRRSADLWEALERAYIPTIQGPIPTLREVEANSTHYATVFQEQISSFLGTAPAYPTELFQGAGVVMVAGGMRYLPAAYATIRLLRRAGCGLPIEVWHLAAERLPPTLEAMFHERFHVIFKSIDDVAPGIFKGFALKVVAMLFSQFEQIIMIDADNHAISDPTVLLATPEFIETGLLMWPDLWFYEPFEHDLFWELVGQPARAAEAAPAHESGQLVIHKRRVWNALLLTLFWTQQHHVWFHVTVPNGAGIGDKELLPLSCRFLKLPYSLVKFPPRVAGKFMKPMKALPHHQVLSEAQRGFITEPMQTETMDPNGYTYFRLEIRGVRRPEYSDLTHLAEIALYDPDGSRLPVYGSHQVRGAMSPTGRSPGGEGAEALMDGNLTSKWLSTFPPADWIVLFQSRKKIGSYALFTANDEPRRDPVSWQLSASIDGANWVRLHRTCHHPTTFRRNARVGPFVIPQRLDETPCTDKPKVLPTVTADTALNGHTQVQHSPDGQMLFLHRNCHKLSVSQALVGSTNRTWLFLAWQDWTEKLLISPRAVILPNEAMADDLLECRFRLIHADHIVRFVDFMPFDIEDTINVYLRELYEDPAFRWYARLRRNRYHDVPL